MATQINYALLKQSFQSILKTTLKQITEEEYEKAIKEIQRRINEETIKILPKVELFFKEHGNINELQIIIKDSE